MLFHIHGIDKPDHLEVRKANRDAHLAYVRDGFLDRIVLGGPTMDAGGDMNGSVLVIDFDGLAEAEAFCAGDPYARAGLFESVTIRPMKKVFAG